MMEKNVQFVESYLHQNSVANAIKKHFMVLTKIIMSVINVVRNSHTVHISVCMHVFT